MEEQLFGSIEKGFTTNQIQRNSMTDLLPNPVIQVNNHDSMICKTLASAYD